MPRLITLYPSGSTLVTPDSFASQVMAANHRILGENLAVSCRARIISVYVGHVQLPHLHSMILSAGPHCLAETGQGGPTARERRPEGFPHQRPRPRWDYRPVPSHGGQIGYRYSHGRDYGRVRAAVLTHHQGPGLHLAGQVQCRQYSFLTLALSRLPLFALPRLLDILPIMPARRARCTLLCRHACSAQTVVLLGLVDIRGAYRRQRPPPSQHQLKQRPRSGGRRYRRPCRLRACNRQRQRISSKGMDSDSGAVQRPRLELGRPGFSQLGCEVIVTRVSERAVTTLTVVKCYLDLAPFKAHVSIANYATTQSGQLDRAVTSR